MATLGSMIVNVLANTAGFAKGMKETREGLASVEKAAGTVTDVLGAVGIGFSAYAIVGELRKTAEEMDNLAKVADRLGITTQALKGLEYGAGLAGVSSESLAGSLQFMTKQIGEAIHGGGKAKAVFKEMGLSMDSLRTLSPEKQLMVIAEELNQMADEAERTRAALRLFGGDGATMLNFLAEGESGIRKYMKEAERLGLTYSREEAAKVEEFNDAWEKLSKTLGGFTKDMVIDITPAALGAVNAIQETLEGARILSRASRDEMTPNQQAFVDRANRAIGPGQFKGLYDWYMKWHDSTHKVIMSRLTRDAGKIRFAPPQMSKSWTGPFGDPTPEKSLGWGGIPGALPDDIGLIDNTPPAILNMGMYMRRMSKAFASQPQNITNAFGSMAKAMDSAKEFGRTWQNKWLLGEVLGRPGDQAINDIFSKRDTEAQVRGLKFLSDKLGLTKGFSDFRKMFSESGATSQGGRFGVNSPLIKGSMEAARLELAQQNKPQKQILDESRKHTSLLTTIAKQLTLQVTGI